jgi:integrase
VIFNDATLLKDLQEYIDERREKGIIKDHLFLSNENKGYQGAESICSKIRSTGEEIAATLIEQGNDVGQFGTKITCHTLRRTFATQLAEILSLKDLAYLMGHSSARVTEKYYVQYTS